MSSWFSAYNLINFLIMKADISLAWRAQALFVAGCLVGAGAAALAYDGVTPGQAARSTPALLPSLTYPAEVTRVIDGDTFEARVVVWPNHIVQTHVRLARINAPEMRGHCAHERQLADAARDRLAALLDNSGPVLLSDVQPDKYFGRVVAEVRVGATNASAVLLHEGHAVRYGHRAHWCG
jgi:endonuclease YncB( thermonuclease family)